MYITSGIILSPFCACQKCNLINHHSSSVRQSTSLLLFLSYTAGNEKQRLSKQHQLSSSLKQNLCEKFLALFLNIEMLRCYEAN